MSSGYSEACACAASCCEFATQTLAATIIQLDKIRRDPQAFQRTCIVALAIIREINFQSQSNYFPHLVAVLEIAPSFDFYGFCRLPRYFLHPYTPQSLDEYAILDQLEAILCDNWRMGIPDDQGKNRDLLVRQFVQKQLEAFLENMVEDDLDFRTEQEVKTILYNWLQKTLQVEPVAGFNWHAINLQDLKIPLKEVSWLEAIASAIFVVVDLACVPSFLRSWSLISLAPYAHAIGRLPFLSWIPKHNLDDWVWGAMGVGYILEVLSATESLWKGGLTPEQTKDAQWLIVTSIAECVYAFANLQNHHLRLINYLALIAKSIGLTAFFLASKPTFFNDD
jgi:hypothetical protein